MESISSADQLPASIVRFPLLRMRWFMCILYLGGLAVAQDKVDRCSNGDCEDISSSMPALQSQDTINTSTTSTLHDDITEESSLRNPIIWTQHCHKKKCCALNLEIGENVIVTNETIRIANIYFSINETKVNGTDVTVCYPNTRSFIDCPAWVLNPQEVKKDGLAIRNTQTGQRFELGEYMITEEGYWVCISDDAKDYESFKNKLYHAYVVAYIISIVSLIITIKIQMSSKKPMTNQKAVLLSHMFSLFMGYLMLLIQYTMKEQPMKTLCFVMGVMIQYSFLAASCWLNILAFVHWRKFADFQSLVIPTDSIRMKQFLCHCLCGWGIPLVLCVIAIYLHLSGAMKHSDECWITNTLILLGVFYGPMGLTTVNNSILTILMICNIRKSRKTLAKVTSNAINQKINLLNLTMKLVAIMHICWIFEIISWLHGDNKRYWFLLDIINALQGFFLFLVYTCRRDFFKKIATTVTRWWKRIIREQSVVLDTNNKQQFDVSVLSSCKETDDRCTSSTQIL